MRAVDGVTFSVEQGKTLGIVGESGCGKSVTMLTVMGLNSRRNTTSSGEALFNGENLLTMKPSRLRDIRGDEVAMIFQDPMTSLNPVHSIGKQLVEAVLLHKDVSKKEARARAVEALAGGRHPARRAAHRRLPAPVLGRHAAARDDRDGDDQRSRAPDRRRADDGARRDHAGADPQADEQAAGGPRDGDPHHHARPRRRRRDRRRRRRHVRGEDRGGGDGRLDLQPAAPPLHVGPARLAAAARHGRRAPCADSRAAAVAAQPARRLPLQPPLPLRDGRVPAEAARAARRVTGDPGHGRRASSTRRRRTARPPACWRSTMARAS